MGTGMNIGTTQWHKQFLKNYNIKWPEWHGYDILNEVSMLPNLIVSYYISMIIVSTWKLYIIKVVQTWPKPDNLAKPPDADPILAQTEGLLGRRRVSILKNQHQRVEWRVCISKTRETQKYLAKSYKNKPDPAISRLNLARSQPDPARSVGI